MIVDITSGLETERRRYQQIASDLRERVPDQLADLLQVERELSRQLADVRERISVRRQADAAAEIADQLGELISRHRAAHQPVAGEAIERTGLARRALAEPTREAVEAGAYAEPAPLGEPVAGQAATETMPDAPFPEVAAPVADGHGTAGPAGVREGGR